MAQAQVLSVLHNNGDILLGLVGEAHCAPLCADSFRAGGVWLVQANDFTAQSVSLGRPHKDLCNRHCRGEPTASPHMMGEQQMFGIHCYVECSHAHVYNLASSFLCACHMVQVTSYNQALATS